MESTAYVGECPACAGPLRQAAEPQTVECSERGHTFTVPELEHDQAQAVRRALWSAEKALNSQALGLQLIGESAGVDHGPTIQRLREDAEVVRGLARRWDGLVADR
ncbi:hypothetical protein CLV35_1993 [Motilibacter peucedani]|uniref:Uncharacterized protein n=1 Tax=Motilibacter peucedani TaxID=598650 RepID=A0A420XQF3_9ACTN|nr:hypothetical protein [Motilibacter peucedani]RKS75523.1 hypothetical protein CLV35_1993 [Motilibacter peucedani]